MIWWNSAICPVKYSDSAEVQKSSVWSQGRLRWQLQPWLCLRRTKKVWKYKCGNRQKQNPNPLSCLYNDSFLWYKNNWKLRFYYTNFIINHRLFRIVVCCCIVCLLLRTCFHNEEIKAGESNFNWFIIWWHFCVNIKYILIFYVLCLCIVKGQLGRRHSIERFTEDKVKINQ